MPYKAGTREEKDKEKKNEERRIVTQPGFISNNMNYLFHMMFYLWGKKTTSLERPIRISTNPFFMLIRQEDEENVVAKIRSYYCIAISSDTYECICELNVPMPMPINCTVYRIEIIQFPIHSSFTFLELSIFSLTRAFGWSTLPLYVVLLSLRLHHNDPFRCLVVRPYAFG